MTYEQALQILDNAASSAPMTRLQHVRVQEAVEILRKLVEEKSNGGAGLAAES